MRLDGSDDVVGIVLQTALGGSAVQLAGQLVDIAENVEQLRAAYLQHAEAGLQDLAGHAGHEQPRQPIEALRPPERLTRLTPHG